MTGIKDLLKNEKGEIMEWVLVIFLHIGNGEAMTSISGFKTKEACQKAGQDSEELTGNLMFSKHTFVCLEKK